MTFAANREVELQQKIESVKKLHQPSYYVFIHITNSYYGDFVEALQVGLGALDGKEPAFVLCSVCHSSNVEEDEGSGAYFRHHGSYPCETVQLLSE